MPKRETHAKFTLSLCFSAYYIKSPSRTSPPTRPNRVQNSVPRRLRPEKWGKDLYPTAIRPKTRGAIAVAPRRRGSGSGWDTARNGGGKASEQGKKGPDRRGGQSTPARGAGHRYGFSLARTAAGCPRRRRSFRPFVILAKASRPWAVVGERGQFRAARAASPYPPASFTV